MQHGFDDFPDRGRALSEFHRVLQSGGRLVVSINTKPERSLTGPVRMAVARHVPSMTAAWHTTIR
jgi:ubiquinone/menaquinone biosynthesis C-methylase UbiE